MLKTGCLRLVVKHKSVRNNIEKSRQGSSNRLEGKNNEKDHWKNNSENPGFRVNKEIKDLIVEVVSETISKTLSETMSETLTKVLGEGLKLMVQELKQELKQELSQKFVNESMINSGFNERINGKIKSKDLLKQEVLRSVRKNKKVLVEKKILAFITEEGVLLSDLKFFIVDQLGYCSKASFYRHVNELKNKGLVILKEENNKTIIMKQAMKTIN